MEKMRPCFFLLLLVEDFLTIKCRYFNQGIAPIVMELVRKNTPQIARPINNLLFFTLQNIKAVTFFLKKFDTFYLIVHKKL